MTSTAENPEHGNNDKRGSRLDIKSNISIVFSLASFILSIIGFIYGYNRNIAQDHNDKIKDFQNTVAQINTLNIQSGEYYVKYKDDMESYNNWIAPTLRAHMALMATKAYSLFQQLSDTVSALDAAVIASALTTTGDFTAGNKMLASAMPLAKTPTEYITIGKMLGSASYYNRNFGEGERYFQLSYDAYDKFQNTGTNDTDILNIKIETLMFWAGAALGANNCFIAQDKINQIDSLLKQKSLAIPVDNINRLKQSKLKTCGA